jgi:hypothetical protein
VCRKKISDEKRAANQKKVENHCSRYIKAAQNPFVQYIYMQHREIQNWTKLCFLIRSLSGKKLPENCNRIFLVRSFFVPFVLSHSLTLSLSLTHTHTHTHSDTFSLSLSLSLTYRHSLTRTRTHRHFLYLSLWLTYRHSLSLAHTILLSLPHKLLSTSLSLPKKWPVIH